MKIRFLSNNSHKIAEVQRILTAVEVVPIGEKIEELQTEDVHRLVHDKVIKAFKMIGRPLFVEHTGLYLKDLGGLPAGLTQIFWDRLEADRFVALADGLGDRALTATTVIAYCDGKRIHEFRGSINGTVAKAPAGPSDFQWDCVFVPDGYHATLAELGPVKDDISMRRLALDAFAQYLLTDGSRLDS